MKSLSLFKKNVEREMIKKYVKKGSKEWHLPDLCLQIAAECSKSREQIENKSF